ncbi:hypothetical protein IWW38_001341 [Coemansia aciculifera]|uniref:Uncharacterized protein n=1 Tax=Coemansia aciculifera TaxID=417176 RepID=A0ACC1M6J0_9FUNG|nr:hypothetical protein IWW38_001341 [Coemansia aciculifera]
MARFSCCGLLRWSISTMCLLITLLILAVPVGLMVLLLVLTFKTPSITLPKVLGPGELPGKMLHLAWQEPFAYEAKVYTSLSPTYSNSQSFFETAQLLWHIEPQQLGNRYPVFRRKVSVHIPSQLRSGPGTGQRLYAHMFVQQTGRLHPHPDLTDPYLVTSTIPLVQWSNSTSTDLTNDSASGAYNKDHGRKLLGVSSASWAMILENHTYSWYNMPPYLTVTNKYSGATAYNPPLLPNTFTKRQPKEEALVALKDKKLAADVYQQTIDVELELSGIKRGWVTTKRAMTGFLDFKKPTIVVTVVPDLLNSGQSFTHSFKSWVKNEEMEAFDRLLDYSVPKILYIVMCLFLLFALGPASIRLAVRLWSTPRSRWIGASRATVTIWLIAESLSVVGSAIHKANCWYMLNPEFLAVVIVATFLDDMPFVPWVTLSRRVFGLFRRKTLPTLDRSSSAQQLMLVAESKAEAASTTVDATSNPYFRRPELVVATRQSVDDIAIRWLRLLSLPLIAITTVLVLIAQDGDYWSLDSAVSLISWIGHAFLLFTWVPQIFLNYKTKSGSLTPVTYNVLSLASHIIGGVLGHSIDGSGFTALGIFDYPLTACHAILILQRIAYYKRAKQD